MKGLVIFAGCPDEAIDSAVRILSSTLEFERKKKDPNYTEAIKTALEKQQYVRIKECDLYSTAGLILSGLRCSHHVQ